MIYLIIVLVILTLIMGYISFNMLKKIEKQEDIIISQEQYIELIEKAINFSEQKLKEIDEKGSFKSDDEIGWFFNNVKDIQEYISEFKARR